MPKIKQKAETEEETKEEIAEENENSPKESEKEITKEREKKEDKKRKEIEAIVNIYASFNNTVAHVTDMSGRTIAKVSGGMVTKHGRLKANPTIAMFVSKRIEEALKEAGVNSVYVRIRAKTKNPAPGPGAHSIVKSMSRAGFKILNILDTTRNPRGGPKSKGGRRGRRP